jgi:hypothetical protein
LLDEGIGNGLHAVQWADDNDGRPSADDEPELPGVLGELIGVVRVSQVLDGVVLDSVTKLFHSLGMLKGESITLQLTSCLTGLELAV